MVCILDERIPSTDEGKERMADIIYPDGRREQKPVLTLREAERIISGNDQQYQHLVQVVRFDGGGALLVDEEGLIFKLPLNEMATVIAGRRIVGTAIKMTRAEFAAWGRKSS